MGRFWAVVAAALVGAVVLAYVLIHSGQLGYPTPEKADRFFVALTALGTLFLGIATVWLGAETRRLGTQEVLDRRLSVRPVLVFEHQPPQIGSELSIQIRNIGVGPALDCKYYYVCMRSDSGENIGRMSLVLSLAAGDNLSKVPGGLALTESYAEAEIVTDFTRELARSKRATPQGEFCMEIVTYRDSLGNPLWARRGTTSRSQESGEGMRPPWPVE